uniref:Uncharacterized protein n=1 Tax=Oryza punctata TaxID=4537 RepID=A0A0E0MDE5_ORYPU
MEEEEVDEGNHDLDDRDEGCSEHRAPLPHTPCHYQMTVTISTLLVRAQAEAVSLSVASVSAPPCSVLMKNMMAVLE